MLGPGSTISFPSGEVQITNRLHKTPTCSYYHSSSPSNQYLIKSFRTSTSQLQEIKFQGFLVQKLIPADPHILSLYDQTSSVIFPDLAFFKLEYAENGTLKKFMRTHELTNEQVCFIFKEILLAVIRINESGIVHRDISPGNIWIDKSFNFKLSGFERSLRMDNNQQMNLEANSMRLNHPGLRPPDLTTGVVWDRYDVWGLGCLLYYLVYRDVPYGNEQKMIQVPEHISELLQACLQANPYHRPLLRNLISMLGSCKLPTRPLVFKASEKPVIALKYSFRSSVRQALTLNANPPDLFYLQQITFASWTATESLNELWQILSESSLKITLIAIKCLIIIHRLLLSGPKEVLCISLINCLEKIINCWTIRSKELEDEFFCEYFSGLIRQLSRVLIEKVKFHMKSKTLSSWKSNIEPVNFPECINFLSKIVRICEGLSMGMQILPNMNSIVAMQLVEESQRLINAIASLDKTSEIRQYNERLAMLDLDPQRPKPEIEERKAMKNEKFETQNAKSLVNASTKNMRAPAKIKANIDYNEEIQDKCGRTENHFYPQEKADNNIFSLNAANNSLRNKKRGNESFDYANLLELQLDNAMSKKLSPSAKQATPLVVGMRIMKKNPQPPPEVKLSPVPFSLLDLSASSAIKNKLPQSKDPVLSVINQVKDGKVSIIDTMNPLQQHLPVFSPIVSEPQKSTLSKKQVQNTPIQKTPADFSNLLDQDLSILPKPSQQNPEILPSLAKISELKPDKLKNPEPSPPSYAVPPLKNSYPNANLPNPLQSPFIPPPLPPATAKLSKSKFSIEDRWVISPSQLKYGPVLGTGASCTVFKGEFKRTPVAIKVMRESYAGQDIVQEFQREVSAMVSLRHPNLVLFMGASITPQMLIVSEFCAGESLFKLLHEKRQIMLHWNQKFKMILDIARGMLYLHESTPQILHRDLKSLNLLLMDEVHGQGDFVLVKVTDFGIARIVEEVQQKMTCRMGTCHWMAPEVINGEPYSFPADVYSFGIVVWEIAARETPYKGLNPVDVTMKVLRGERPDLSLIGPQVPSAIKDLICWCWDTSPTNRPTFRQVIEFLDKLQSPHDY